ncbi:MAG: hypothetical protein M0Z52_07735 [Actinomycetota bacterium]|nr:hypothetical protein [Actinomycetota bacterium]MDA8175369.1 hypothetical protein [Nitrospiraceae bacterium]
MPKTAAIEEALTAAPNNYKLLFENDRVRMLDLSIDPGDRTVMHSLRDHLVYIVTDCTATFISPGGQPEQCTLNRGQATWFPARSHEIANNGTKPMEAIIVEFKS